MAVRSFCNVLVAIAALLLLGAHSYGNDWPHWRGPDYDGISKETQWDPSGKDSKILWEAQVGIGFSAVSVANGKAYTIGNINKETDVVYCFDAVTGKELWRHEYPEKLGAKYYEGGTHSTPTIENGKVYTVSKFGKVFCLDADTGAVVWQIELPFKTPEWGFATSALIVGEKLILNVGSAGLALDKATGRIIWKSDNSEPGYATPVPYMHDGIPAVAIFGKDTVMGIQIADGKQLWSAPWKTQYDVNASDPIIVGKECFVTSGYNRGAGLIDFSQAQPKMVWENKNMRSQLSGPVLIDGYLYGIDDNQLVCLNWKTGQKKWAFADVKKGAVSAAGSTLIVIGEKGMLYTIKASPESCQPIASVPVLNGKCWTMPVLANGRLYVRDTGGHLVCVDMQDKNAPLVTPAIVPAENPQWPQWQGPNRDNLSSETGLLKQWPAEGPKMLWAAEGIGEGYSSPTIAEGRIYITGMKDNEGFLTCLDMDGKQLWTANYGPEWRRATPGVRCTPTVDNGCVYVISGTGQVGCFDAQSGQKLWLVDAFGQLEGQYGMWGIAESPLIVEDKVIFIVGGKKAMVAALNKKDGSTVWTVPSNGSRSAYSSPIAFQWGGKTSIAGMTESVLFGLNAADGTVLWTFPIQDYVSRNQKIHPNTPYFKDGLIFYTSGYDMGAVQLRIAPDAASVEKVWTNPEIDCHHGGFVVLDGYIYTSDWRGNDNGYWLCADWKTGKILWTHKWLNKGSLTFADGLLYCYAEKDGQVGLVKPSPEAFNLISAFPITKGQKEHWAHPVVCGKTLYIRHGDVLMAYDIAA
ncbi:MAG TPA: PQQ-binding-like beta-propeller repeat protein [Anaerohalosphaeraceae bacterium]|nr:PQQ-binding-like beta-propeller repeat protein [Anaerohalosphaeraceae bacterium]